MEWGYVILIQFWFIRWANLTNVCSFSFIFNQQGPTCGLDNCHSVKIGDLEKVAESTEDKACFLNPTLKLQWAQKDICSSPGNVEHSMRNVNILGKLTSSRQLWQRPKCLKQNGVLFMKLEKETCAFWFTPWQQAEMA